MERHRRPARLRQCGETGSDALRNAAGDRLLLRAGNCGPQLHDTFVRLDRNLPEAASASDLVDDRAVRHPPYIRRRKLLFSLISFQNAHDLDDAAVHEVVYLALEPCRTAAPHRGRQLRSQALGLGFRIERKLVNQARSRVHCLPFWLIFSGIARAVQGSTRCGKIALFSIAAFRLFGFSAFRLFGFSAFRLFGKYHANSASVLPSCRSAVLPSAVLPVVTR